MNIYGQVFWVYYVIVTLTVGLHQINIIGISTMATNKRTKPKGVKKGV